MPTLYLATLGQRPEAITVALDRLREHFTYDAAAVLHTEAHSSTISHALRDLRAVFARDYAALPLHLHALCYGDGAPLLDIADQASAEAYHNAVLRTLHHYQREGWHLHLMLAGGRKAMSIYAMLAASLLFNPPLDRVWTVLSPPAMTGTTRQFHIPPGMRQQVQLVELPLRPARIARGTDIALLLERPQSQASMFLKKLTPAERALAETLCQHPYDSNQQLGELIHKSSRTVENQLGSIYTKLTAFLDYGERLTDKRQSLLDLLRDR